jgi:hypothetical protein
MCGINLPASLIINYKIRATLIMVYVGDFPENETVFPKRKI